MHVLNLLPFSDPAKNMTIRNNVFHDSYNNGILKINNGANNIVIEGNMIYNLGNYHQHIAVTSAKI